MAMLVPTSGDSAQIAGELNSVFVINEYVLMNTMPIKKIEIKVRLIA